MQAAFASFVVLFILGCIGLVVAHLSGVIDPTKYEFMRGVLPIAYLVPILAAGLIASSIAASVFKK